MFNLDLTVQGLGPAPSRTVGGRAVGIGLKCLLVLGLCTPGSGKLELAERARDASPFTSLSKHRPICACPIWVWVRVEAWDLISLKIGQENIATEDYFDSFSCSFHPQLNKFEHVCKWILYS